MHCNLRPPVMPVVCCLRPVQLINFVLVIYLFMLLTLGNPQCWQDWHVQAKCLACLQSMLL